MIRMRVLKRDERKGIVTVKVDGQEDLYWLSLIIKPGDLITARTTRRYKPEGQQRADSGERVPVTLTIEVEKVEVGPRGTSLRVLGVVRRAPEWLGIQGKHHSLDISPGSQLTIQKESWSDTLLEFLDRAERSTLSPKVLAVALDDRNALVAVISDFRVTPEVSLRASRTADPRSKRIQSALNREFQRELAELLERLAERYSPEAIVLTGPGFFKEELASFIEEKSPELANLIRVVDSSSATLSGIYEVLRRGEIDRVARELSISRDAGLLQDFLRELSKGSGLVTYGLKQVSQALSLGAVETLLLSSKLLFDPSTRDEAMRMLEMCRRTRASFRILDSDSEPGQMLDSLGGVVAFLRFPVSE